MRCLYKSKIPCLLIYLNIAPIIRAKEALKLEIILLYTRYNLFSNIATKSVRFAGSFDL